MHRRRHPGLRLLARDFAIIFGTWAVTAYPIIWLNLHYVGPALLGGTP